MIRSLIFFFLIGLSFGCKHKIYKNKDLLNAIVKNVDKLKISFFSESGTVVKEVTEYKYVKVFKDLITGEIDSTIQKCAPNGSIIFIKQNKIVFEALFTIEKPKESNCKQLTYFLSPQQYIMILPDNANNLLYDLKREISFK